MAVQRVFQISLETHVEAELVMQALASLGKPVVGRTSPVDPAVAEQVRDLLLSGWQVGDPVGTMYLKGPQTPSRTTDESAAASNVAPIPLPTDTTAQVAVTAVSDEFRTVVPDTRMRSSVKFGDPTRRPGVAKVLREYLERYAPDAAAAVDQPWPEQELNATQVKNAATQARRMRKQPIVPAPAPAKVTGQPTPAPTRRAKARSTAKLEDSSRLPSAAQVLRHHPEIDVQTPSPPIVDEPSLPRKKRNTRSVNRAIQAAKTRKPAAVPIVEAPHRRCTECGKVVTFGLSTGKVVVHFNANDERCSGSQRSRELTAEAGRKNTAASERNVDGKGKGKGKAGEASKKTGARNSGGRGVQRGRYFEEYGGQNSVRTVSGGMPGHGKRS